MAHHPCSCSPSHVALLRCTYSRPRPNLAGWQAGSRVSMPSRTDSYHCDADRRSSFSKHSSRAWAALHPRGGHHLELMPPYSSLDCGPKTCGYRHNGHQALDKVHGGLMASRACLGSATGVGALAATVPSRRTGRCEPVCLPACLPACCQVVWQALAPSSTTHQHSNPVSHVAPRNRPETCAVGQCPTSHTRSLTSQGAPI